MRTIPRLGDVATAAMESFWLLLEIGGVALLSVFAMLGTKKSMNWLAVGWSLLVFRDAGALFH